MTLSRGVKGMVEFLNYSNVFRFSDLLQDCPQEGSPASFRMFLSGTVMVNSIVDLLIHAMLINQSMEECQNHDEEDNECVGHAFNSEAWWRKNLFVLVKDKDSLSEEEYVKGEEIYREFIQVGSDISFHLFIRNSLSLLMRIISAWR